MSKENIAKQLEYLRDDIKDHAKYLEEYTYSPYEEIYKFADRLTTIINDIKEEL